jgi:hypothetical protein
LVLNNNQSYKEILICNVLLGGWNLDNKIVKKKFIRTLVDLVTIRQLFLFTPPSFRFFNRKNTKNSILPKRLCFMYHPLDLFKENYISTQSNAY